MHNRFSRVSLSLSALAAAAVLLASPLPSYALTQEAIPTQPQSQDQAPAPIQNSQPAAALSPAQPIASLSPYQLLPNSIPDLEERYLAWGEANPQLSAEQVVLAVNIGLDKAYYEDNKHPKSFAVSVQISHRTPLLSAQLVADKTSGSAHRPSGSSGTAADSSGCLHRMRQRIAGFLQAFFNQLSGLIGDNILGQIRSAGFHGQFFGIGSHHRGTAVHR